MTHVNFTISDELKMLIDEATHLLRRIDRDEVMVRGPRPGLQGHKTRLQDVYPAFLEYAAKAVIEGHAKDVLQLLPEAG